MVQRQSHQRDFLTTFSEGRSGRPQFWSFYAFVAVPSVGFIAAAFMGERGEARLIPAAAAAFWALLFFVPLTAVMARRFHDIGKSGWWAAGQFFAVIFSVCVTVLYPLGRPDFEGTCSTYRVVPGTRDLLMDRFEYVPLTADEKARCNEYLERRSAYRRRGETLSWWLIGLVATTHMATIFYLLKPSQPSPNKYGPNPHEVTP